MSNNLDTVIRLAASGSKAGVSFVLVWAMIAFWSFIGLTAIIILAIVAIDPPPGPATNVGMAMVALAYIAWALVMVHAIGISIWRRTSR